MLWLALKTLVHERSRFLITVAGLAFSSVLVLMQVGMYLGMMGNATAVIRHTDADIWVTSKNVQSFDFSNPFPEERINRVKSLSEVLSAERIIMTWGFLKLEDGGIEQVQIIGFDPDSGIGAPWSMVSGAPLDVKGGSYMIGDVTSEQRVGKLRVGSVWELSGKKFKLVGLSKGIKSFTTAPVFFMSYNEARTFWGGAWFGTSFIAAKVRDKRDIGRVAAALRATMRENDVFTRNGFIKKTVLYWTVQTGLGMAFFLTAILGLVIGGAIVGQTIYANTMEHLKEYGTLKAIGAKNRDVYTVIFSQASINAVAGFLSGGLIILFSKGAIERAGVSLYLNLWISALIFLMILSTCVFSAYFSVRKIKKLDPVMVFRG